MQLLVVRHARSVANAEGILAGRMDGVHLDETGRQQAESLVSRFLDVPVDAIFGSPLTRCRETAEPIVIERRLAYQVDDRLNEVDYGAWSNRSLKELNSDPLWDEVQRRPSQVTFPEGEAMVEVQARVTDFVESMRVQDGETALAFTHGDVAKAMLAYCFGMPLDAFQRIVIEPASVSVIRLTKERTFVLRVNESTSTLKDMLKRPDKDATVGGGI